MRGQEYTGAHFNDIGLFVQIAIRPASYYKVSTISMGRIGWIAGPAATRILDKLNREGIEPLWSPMCIIRQLDTRYSSTHG
jgi:hypothetical protein